MGRLLTAAEVLGFALRDGTAQQAGSSYVFSSRMRAEEYQAALRDERLFVCSTGTGFVVMWRGE